jgi:hypothetical protein
VFFCGAQVDKHQLCEATGTIVVRAWFKTWVYAGTCEMKGKLQVLISTFVPSIPPCALEEFLHSNTFGLLIQLPRQSILQDMLLHGDTYLIALAVEAPTATLDGLRERSTTMVRMACYHPQTASSPMSWMILRDNIHAISASVVGGASYERA